MADRLRKGFATVVAQRDGELDVEYDGERLTARMKGFPPGFQLAAGAHVVLMDGDTGTLAMPLVRATRALRSREVLEQQGELQVARRGFAAQEHSAIDNRRPDTRSEADENAEYVYWVIDSEPSDAPGQIVAARPARA